MTTDDKVALAEAALAAALAAADAAAQAADDKIAEGAIHVRNVVAVATAAAWQPRLAAARAALSEAWDARRQTPRGRVMIPSVLRSRGSDSWGVWMAWQGPSGTIYLRGPGWVRAGRPVGLHGPAY